MRITPQTYPVICAAFLEIQLDNGMINRIDGGPPAFYDVPEQYDASLSHLESALAALSKDQLHIFCCGEVGEMDTLIHAGPVESSRMLEAHEFLNAFFEDWTT